MKYFIAISIIGIMAFFAPLAVSIHAENQPAGLEGTWDCCGEGGAAVQVFVITLGIGSLDGKAELPSGRVFAAITGNVDFIGRKVEIVTTYNDFYPGYVAVFKGSVSVDGNTISGTWASNGDQEGTFTATRRGTESSPGESVAVAKVVELKGKGEIPHAEFFREGKWQPLGMDSQLRPGDKVRTDKNTEMAMEFALGGRVGIKPNSEIQVVGERRIESTAQKSTLVKILKLITGHVWARSKVHAEPIEIQTNGGVTSIKG